MGAHGGFVPSTGPRETTRILSSQAEGQRLWNQLTKGMEGIYRVAKDYADAELPGDPLTQLRLIHTDLGDLIRKLEQRPQ